MLTHRVDPSIDLGQEGRAGHVLPIRVPPSAIIQQHYFPISKILARE